MKKDNDKQKKIPTGKLGRTHVVGITTAKAGLKKLEHASRKPFMSAEKRKLHREKTDDEIARMIFRALATLKGAPLKLAQMMAMELDLLPEVYQRELARSANQVPPMNRALIRSVVTRELGGAPEKIFRSFDPVPFAAASLGQVHRAESFDGEILAVKVQYPGVADAVNSDMEMFASVLKLTPLSGMLSGILPELGARIREELDYRLESKNTKWFRRHCSLPGIVIPMVHDEYSTERILTTSLISGLHLEEWLAMNPSQEQKNSFGQTLCDLFAESVHEHRLIHADPNLGNFLFREDGRLGVIDFGCVKRLDDSFISSLMSLVRAIESRDMTRIREQYAGIGIYCRDNATDTSLKDTIIEWLEWVTRPIREEYFDFSEHRDYFAEGRKFLPLIYRLVDRYDGALLYYGRFEYGLYRILHRLGARVKIGLYRKTI